MNFKIFLDNSKRGQVSETLPFSYTRQKLVLRLT